MSTAAGEPGNRASSAGSAKNRLVSLMTCRTGAYLPAANVTSQCRPYGPSRGGGDFHAQARVERRQRVAGLSCCRNGSLCCPVTGRRVSDTQLEPTRSITPSSSRGGRTFFAGSADRPRPARADLVQRPGHARHRPGKASRPCRPRVAATLILLSLRLHGLPSGSPRAYNRRTPPPVAVRRR